MSETLSYALLLAAGLYLSAGFLFALAFLSRGIDRIDPAARGSSLGFRLLVLPGVTALWPILAQRWFAGPGAPPEQVDAHARAARAESAP